MSALTNIIETLRAVDLERTLGLQAAPPPVAVELDRRELVLVRLKAKRRGRPWCA